jgi:diacylglycerol kinase family enzyme/membrane-associated phospholipid phosphatase
VAFDVRRAEPRRPGLIWFAAGTPALLWLILALGVAADAGWLQALDRPLTRWALGLSTTGGWHTFGVILGATFSTWTARIALLAAAAYTGWRREYRLTGWIVGSGVLVLLGNPVLKLLFDRPRPRPLVHTWWQGGDLSFPSGHAAGMGVVCTIAILLTISATMRGLKRRLLITGWVALGLLVAFSRIVLGAHYLSDVLAGLAFGAAVTVTAWALVVPQSARIPHDLAVLTGTGRKRVAVILNPIKVGDIDSFKGKVYDVVLREGWNVPLWFETTVEDPGAGQAQAALEAGVDLIVTAGGDGTVRAVCAEGPPTRVADGINPLGTGNQLARNMGLPLNTREAIEVAFSGQDRAIDLATFATNASFDFTMPAPKPKYPELPAPAATPELTTGPKESSTEPEPGRDVDKPEEPSITETSFLVMAGLGMDAEIMSGVDDRLKEKVGWFAYFLSGMKALRFPTMRVHISVDDGPFHRFRARTVVIGNVGFLQAGIPLLPNAQLDDGLLDVVVLAPKRFIGWIAIVVRVMGRTQRTDKALNRMTGHRIVVRTEAPAPMQLDGDPVGSGTEITAEVHHGVLLVRVPVQPAAPE